MTSPTDRQREAFDRQHADLPDLYWSFHDTQDALTRFLRDRRIRRAVSHVCPASGCQPSEMDALVVCGGVGGEGTLLANLAFRSVTVSDFSDEALRICRKRDPRLSTLNLDAENLTVPENSYDFVLVQDGLHHLSRPVLGLTEMLRVARKAVVVIEPHTGIVADLFGTEWEREGDAVNWIFRWNRRMFEQVVRSYLLDTADATTIIRLWDHNLVMGRIARMVGGGRVGLGLVRFLYFVLDAVVPWLGNMMVGVVIKSGCRSE